MHVISMLLAKRKARPSTSNRIFKQYQRVYDKAFDLYVHTVNMKYYYILRKWTCLHYAFNKCLKLYSEGYWLGKIPDISLIKLFILTFCVLMPLHTVSSYVFHVHLCHSDALCWVSRNKNKI